MKHFFLLAIMFSFSVSAAQFPDVSPQNESGQAVQYLAERGMVSGYPDGSFKPLNRISRVEFIKISIGAAEIPVDTSCTQAELFSDIQMDQWYIPYLCAAVRQEIIRGYDDGTFRPLNRINLAEAAKITARVFQLNEAEEPTTPWYKAPIEALAQHEALPLSLYTPEQDITRMQMAEIAARVHEKGNYSSLRYEDLTDGSPTFASCEAMKDHMSTGPIFMPFVSPMLRNGTAVMEMAVMSDAGAVSSKGSFTRTNTQERGIDEADTVKTNGRVFVTKHENTVQILDATTPETLQILGQINLEKEGMYMQNMYLNQNQLLLIGSTASNRYPTEPIVLDGVEEPFVEESRMIWPGPSQQRSKVLVYDISTPSEPALERTIEMDGSVQTSRRIGQNVFFVLNQPLWNMNEDTIPLPKIYENGSAQTIAECDEVNYMPGSDAWSFTTILQLNLQNKTTNGTVLAGNAEQIYMSQNAFYMTMQEPYQHFTDRGPDDMAKTRIFAYDLTPNGVQFRARGAVPGNIENQWNLNEWNGNLRISTTSRPLNGETENNMYVLDDTMQTIGVLEGLAPGERIYATRYMGDRAYLVTFEAIDPLFVLDLNDPQNPRVLGELKIPGFSEYLHPWGDDMLLGFGQEAVPNADNTNAQIQGLKLALFDVSDVKNPTVLDTVLLGDRGSSSPLLYDHHAILVDKTNNLISFPASLTRVTTHNEWGEFDWQGALVYSVEGTAFQEQGRITHMSGWSSDWEKEVQRSVRINDSLWTISPQYVQTNAVTGLEAQSRIDLKTGTLVDITVPTTSEVPTLLQIQKAAAATTCEFDRDCSAVAYGARACGGPAGYLALNMADDANATEALAMIETYTAAQKKAVSGMIGTCEAVLRPEVRCEQMQCETLDSEEKRSIVIVE